MSLQTFKSHTPMAPLVLNREESAELLRVSTRQVDSLIARGELKSVRIGSRVLVAWAELVRFVDSKQARRRLDHEGCSIEAAT
jgi:excisionase family DNA binding protein